MRKPLLSIVIPTFNRYKYLIGSLESMLEIDSDEFEVIVQDNTVDNKEILDYVARKNDSRIKYFHKIEHIGMSENCDLGVINSKGDYVCMIGDDDTICSSIIKACHFCKENSIDSCCFPFPGFNWPDMTFENGVAQEPNMFFKEIANGQVRLLDSKQELLASLRSGGSLSSTMPRLYHAIVSRRCLELTFAKIGTYFPGPSPDMANAVPTCLFSQKTAYISDYLIVSGYGKSSARGEGNRNEHFGKIEDKPWLPKDVLEKWEDDVPRIFSAETIIAQSAMQALRTMGCTGSKYKYPLSELYATFYWHHPGARKELLSFVFAKPNRVFLFIKGVFIRANKSIQSKIKGSVFVLQYDSVNTLNEARLLTEEKSNILTYHF